MNKPPAELLAVIGVDRSDRVVCQAPGCGHAVFRRIHIVGHDGTVGVYGSNCFEKLFGISAAKSGPRSGSGEGRELTPDERQMLIENTARLLEQFETERLRSVELERLRREQQEQVARAATARAEEARLKAERRRPPSPAELASVET